MLTLRNRLGVEFKSCIQSNNIKFHNWNPEGLVNLQLHDQVLCLNSRAISPIMARVMSCVALDYTAVSRFALWSVIYNPVVSFDLRCQSGRYAFLSLWQISRQSGKVFENLTTIFFEVCESMLPTLEQAERSIKNSKILPPTSCSTVALNYDG